jgi:hypothetical protein
MHNLHNIDKKTIWMKREGATIIFSVATGKKFKELHRCPAEKVMSDGETFVERTMGIYAQTNGIGNLVSAVLVIKDDSINKRKCKYFLTSKCKDYESFHELILKLFSFLLYKKKCIF